LPVLVIASIALVVTIIGIPVAIVLLPLAVITAFVAFLLGFTALACRIGEWVEDRLRWRGNSAFLAMTIGLVLIVGPTMLGRLMNVAPEPLQWTTFGLMTAGITVEFVVWTMGLGAALMTGLGRWSTVPPPAPPMAQPGILPATN
jgi:purine-cytosine permease-like protein